MNIERKELYEFAGKMLSSHKSTSVLDVACGNGEGTNVLGKILGAPKIAGVDLVPELIEYGKENFGNSRVSFSAANALQLPFSDQSFDGLVCSHAIEHFNESDQKQLLRELRRVLKDNGMLVIATPDRDVWNLQGIAGVQEDHIRELDQKEFWSILKDFNFKIENIYGQCILKENNKFFLRKFLNLLKKIDIFKLRKKIFRNYVRVVDVKTQPIIADFGVQKLQPGQKASITILVCKK